MEDWQKIVSNVENRDLESAILAGSSDWSRCSLSFRTDFQWKCLATESVILCIIFHMLLWTKTFGHYYFPNHWKSDANFTTIESAANWHKFSVEGDQQLCEERTDQPRSILATDRLEPIGIIARAATSFWGIDFHYTRMSRIQLIPHSDKNSTLIFWIALFRRLKSSTQLLTRHTPSRVVFQSIGLYTARIGRRGGKGNGEFDSE